MTRHWLLAAGLASLALPMTVMAQAAANAALPADSKSLAEVQVLGQREEETRGSLQRLDAETLAGQDTNNMADVVRYQPLVSAPGIASGSGNNVWDGSGTTGYNIRGVDGNRVAIDVDGIALPPAESKPDSMQNNSFAGGRDTLEPELYQLVEIESGATASGRPGSNGLGGRVRFITKSPEDFLQGGQSRYLGYKFGYLSSDKSRMHALTGAAQVGGVQALGIYVRRDGEEEKSEGDVAPNPKDWNSNALLTKFVWGAGTNSRLGLGIEHVARDTELTNNNKITAASPYAPRQDGTDRRSRISLEHTWVPQGELAAFDVLDSRIYYQRSEAKNHTTAQVPTAQPRVPRGYERHILTNSEYKTLGVTADASKRLGQHHVFYGAALTRTNNERPWEESRSYLDNGEVAPVAAPVRDRAASARDTRLSLYLRDEIGFTLAGRRATLTPGLTVQHHRLKPTDVDRYAEGSSASAGELRTRSGTDWLPSLNLTVQLQPGFDAFAQYSRGVRQPTVSELTGSFENPGTGYAVLGNPDLKKETSDNFELGVRGEPSRGVTLSASAFYSRYRNYIEYTNIGVDPSLPQFGLFVYRTDNIGKATIWGTELASRFELGEWAPSVQGLSLSLAAGWSKGTARNSETGEKADLPSVLPAKLVLGLGYDDPGKRFGGALHTTWTRGKQAPGADVLRDSTGEYFDVPGATVLDLTAYWNISRNVTWRAGIYNLADRKYWDYASVRDLAASATGDIERQARPGRSFGTSLEVRF
ncbi:TonB-dependent hemoglobin/transferrin/lactoferrin family receptor [Corticibacter populi]|uniref:TonB-dependent hemoglobin/transferrin/lactoferrin family receptor n=1 Tax=Corticibacter populi TaxID=1550736 RepID=UPI0013C2E1D6|nr:TonB-dependent hemoglobin/transferrin/lactoferrin family receptor [Corticibacter populi]